MSQLMLLGNPARRRKTRKNPKRRTRRSAAQRAATMRMLAANRSRSGGHKRRRHVVHANPARRHRRVRRNPTSSLSRIFGGGGSMGVTGMVKRGVGMGVGAVGADVVFGFVAPMLPTTMSTPVAADGVTTQWLYFVAKGATAVGLAALLRKTKMAAAGRMIAEGALTVMSYQIARSMFTSFAPSLTLGAYANTQRTVVNQQRQRLSGMGAYAKTPNMYQGNMIRVR